MASYVSGDKKKLIKWVLQGSVEKVPIDGQTYSNNMPPQNYLTDQQVADILTYIRSSFGNKATAITVADVKAVRASIK
jgi:mono/diheme cytochrome c family protein